MAAFHPAVTLLRNKLVRHWLSEGQKPADVARTLGVSKQTMGAVIRRNGLNRPPPAQLRLAPAERRIVTLARRAGVTIQIEGVSL